MQEIWWELIQCFVGKVKLVLFFEWVEISACNSFQFFGCERSFAFVVSSSWIRTFTLWFISLASFHSWSQILLFCFQSLCCETYKPENIDDFSSAFWNLIKGEVQILHHWSRIMHWDYRFSLIDLVDCFKPFVSWVQIARRFYNVYVTK